jgi:hypothetical protein
VITLLDVPVTPETSRPLALQLHLFVRLPVGRVYKGNRYPDGEDQHFWTVLGVAVPKRSSPANPLSMSPGVKGSAEFADTTI